MGLVIVGFFPENPDIGEANTDSKQKKKRESSKRRLAIVVDDVGLRCATSQLILRSVTTAGE